MTGDDMSDVKHRIYHWIQRTPVQTFVLCPLIVAAFELMWHWGLRGSTPPIVPNTIDNNETRNVRTIPVQISDE